MHLLITGLNGTLAPKVAAAAARRGWQVTGWDRHRVPPSDAGACRAFLLETMPDAIVHLAMGEESWAGLLAAYASERRAPFVFTSTAMVFDCVPDGPHAAGDARTAKDDYGRYKIRCEDAVWASPGPVGHRTVARIGWQIDADDSGHATGNNMLAHLDAQHACDGRIWASTLWRPACSFMADTADALLGLVEQPAGGTVHLDSNAIEGHTFARIVAALKVRYARDQWLIAPNESYRHDQRLCGGEGLMVGLSRRLVALG
jgi:dTDP-4-dehydrorhamnose reductase